MEFEDGIVAQYAANIIEENLYTHCDLEEQQFLELKKIMDHSRYAFVVPISKGYMTSQNGNIYPKKTTRGWKLLVQ